MAPQFRGIQISDCVHMLIMSIGERKLEGWARYFEWLINDIDEKTEKSRQDIKMREVYVVRLAAVKSELKDVREGTVSLS